MQKITPFLWYDTQAEEAVNFYASIFKNSKIKTVTRYADVGPGEKGKVMTVDFELNGQNFVAINGGPIYKFTEAVSFVVNCDSQEEIDFYWEKLSEGGVQQVCGWLKDKYGLSWQVVPSIMGDVMKNASPEKMNKIMGEIMKMKKPEIDKIIKAAED
jgi:predicted 3-demethylubiquinone-9 3-methyltransferase (glyoxalase superfamily)